jgi:hypothetical protein
MKSEFRKGDMLVVIGTKDVLLVNQVKKCTYSLVPVNCGKNPYAFTYNKLVVENSCVKVGRRRRKSDGRVQDR